MTADTLTRPLTESECALVAQYHKLIYCVIEDCKLPNDAAADAYGEAALGLILAAQQYMQDEKLQKYCFSTIAYSRMRAALLRQRRQIFHQPVMLSLDEELPSGTTLYELIPSVSGEEAA